MAEIKLTFSKWVKKQLTQKQVEKQIEKEENEDGEKEILHSARLKEAGISKDYYENGDEYDEGDSSYDEHYN